MMEASVGDCVWVKITGFPWWPAKVTEITFQDNKKKIFVSCFGDNSTHCTSNSKSIRSWNCTEHDKLIDRGRASTKDNLRILFRRAIVETKLYLSSMTDSNCQDMASKDKNDSYEDTNDVTLPIPKKIKLCNEQPTISLECKIKEIPVGSGIVDDNQNNVSSCPLNSTTLTNNVASSEPQNGNDERSYPLSYRSDNTTWMASKETLKIQNDKHGSSRKDNDNTASVEEEVANQPIKDKGEEPWLLNNTTLAGSTHIFEINDEKSDFDDDDDDELLKTEGITPQKLLSERPPEPGDIIWYKYQKFPYWPCLVYNTTKSKTKRVTEMKILFLNNNESHVVKNVNRKKWNFFFSQCEQYKAAGKKSKHYEEFIKSVNTAERLFVRGNRDISFMLKEIGYAPGNADNVNESIDTSCSDEESEFGSDIVPIQELNKSLYGRQIIEIRDDFNSVNGKRDTLTERDEEMIIPKIDCLWAKVSRCPWWPAKVIDVEDDNGTEFITVSFFGENAKHSFKSDSKDMRPWKCNSRKKIIKRGMQSKVLIGKQQTKVLFKKAMAEAKDYIKSQRLASRSELETGSPEPGDIIWYDHESLSYWPAMIYETVNTKKVERYIIIFLEIQDVYNVSGNRKWYFFDDYPKFKTRVVDEKYREDFTEAIKTAEKFLRLEYKDVDYLARNILRYESEDDEDNESEDSLKFNIEDEDSVIDSQLSQELMNIIISEDMKIFLKKVYQGEETSQRHQVFVSGSRSAIANLKIQTGFGPIHRDEHDRLMNVLEELYYEINCDLSPDELFFKCRSYCYDVFLPEAIIHALQLRYNLTFEEAEKKYLPF